MVKGVIPCNVHSWLLIVIATLGLNGVATAQILYGSLVGNVRDPSDAPIPSAKVTITNALTNRTRTTTTNDLGSYSFSTLQPGTYDLAVTKEGFRSHTQTGV